jgi:hypothetical protein
MRSSVRIMLVLLVVASAVVAVSGRSQASFVPETLAHGAPVGVDPVVAPFGIDYLGVLWDLADGGEGQGQVHGAHGYRGGAAHNLDGLEPHGAVRFLDRAGGWGPWVRLVEDGAEGEDHWASGLVFAGGALAYQVRGVPEGVVAPRAVAINVTDGPPVAVAGRPSGAADALGNCRSRAEWGADESLRFDAAGNEIWPPDFYDVQAMIVHHTATSNNDPDPEGRVRAIYRYHAVDRGWGDIGYHYLIDEAGHIYEGRWSGNPSLACSQGGDGADFAHDGAGRLVTAGHTGGYNSGNVGIALLGEFTTHPRFGGTPKAAAVSALEDALAELASRHGLDPLGTVNYVNPVSGDTKDSIATISGHRDWSSTECPGERLYQQLPQIRENVAVKVGQAGDDPPALVVTIDAPTDGATLASGEPVTFEATTGEEAIVSWTSDVDGALGSGTPLTTTLSDGVHTITATASLADATATDTITITLGEPASPPTVSVAAIRQSSDSARFLLVEIETRDHDGTPVAGAELTAQIWHTDTTGAPTSLRDTVSGTTDGDGRVSFRVRIRANPPGCYTTIVTDLRVDGSTWDGLSPSPVPHPYCF